MGQTITSLTALSLGGAGQVFDLNTSGQIAGDTGFSGTYVQACVIENGLVTQLNSLGGYTSTARGINDQGEMVGSSRIASGAEHAALWINGQVSDLNTGNWLASSATGINSQGVIAGNVDATSIIQDQAEIWQNGVGRSLGSLGGIYSIAYGINDANQIFGDAGTASGQTHAFLWQNGVMSDLGTLGGNISYANAINNAGWVAGAAATAQGSQHAVLWQGSTIRDLGSLGGGTGSANGIDASGRVVGSSLTSGYVNHAFLWEDGVMIDLNTLLPSGTGWVLQSATAISDSGQIIGSGTYQGTQAYFSLSLPTSDLILSAQAAIADGQNGTLPGKVYVGDSSATIAADLDSLQALVTAGNVAAIGFSDATAPVLTISQTQLSSDGGALQDIQGVYSLTVTGVAAAQASTTAGQTGVTSVQVTDSAAHILASLGSLESLALSGRLSSVAFTDGGIPTLSLTPAMLSADQMALKAITTDYTITVVAGAASATIDGVSGRGTLAVFSGNASQYSVTPSGDGVGFTLSGHSAIDMMRDITALRFADYTDFIASTSQANGGVSSAQVTDLYAAVFSRTPDVAGLAYYEAAAAANPGIGITTYAQQFLQSPEYTSNEAHNYAQTSAGDTAFITDTYSNLLHRAPEAGAVSWYQANVIAPLLANLTPGTAAYANAELLAHASVLADFSASAEFLGNVQITAAHPADAQHWLILI